MIARTPGLSDLLTNDWRKAAWFYERCGVTEALLGEEAAVCAVGVGYDPDAFVASPVDEWTEGLAAKSAVLPGSE